MATTFTVSQTPASVNLYLYPNAFKPGTGTSGFTASTGTNYECIDEVWNSPNEDTDYVYTISNSNVTDLYTLPDHTTETGTINYVKVLGRSRCTYSAQVSGSSYKILMDVSGVTAYSAQKYPVTTSYADYTYTNTSTPSGAGWTWDAIDDLAIGFEGNSQDYSGTVNLVLNVTSGSTQCNFSDGGCTGFPDPPGDYTNIVGANDDSYLHHNADHVNVNGCAMWHLENTTVSGYTINKVTFYYRTKNEGDANPWDVNLLIYRSGASVVVGNQTQTGSYQTYTYETATDPWTSAAWTWDNVNTIEAGVQFVHPGGGGSDNLQQNISRFYIVVNYTVDQGNEFRTTQCYALVNHTPSATTVTLNQPSSLQVSHSRKIDRHTFHTGDYEVDDYGRAGKTLSLNGQETSTASATMQSLKDMIHHGAVVTVAGLDDTNLNTDYHIADFSFSQEAGMQERYYWSLVLEED